MLCVRNAETSQALEFLLTDIHTGLFWFWALSRLLQGTHTAHVWTDFIVPPRPTIQGGYDSSEPNGLDTGHRVGGSVRIFPEREITDFTKFPKGPQPPPKSSKSLM